MKKQKFTIFYKHQFYFIFFFFISNKIIKSSKGKNVCILFLHKPKLFFFLCFLSHFFKFWKLKHYQETQLHHVVIDLSMNTFMNFTSWRVQFCQYDKFCLMTYCKNCCKNRQHCISLTLQKVKYLRCQSMLKAFAFWKTILFLYERGYMFNIKN